MQSCSTITCSSNHVIFFSFINAYKKNEIHHLQSSPTFKADDEPAVKEIDSKSSRVRRRKTSDETELTEIISRRGSRGPTSSAVESNIGSSSRRSESMRVTRTNSSHSSTPKTARNYPKDDPGKYFEN